MTVYEMAVLVNRWFSEAESGGLVLPEGWFGRPYDCYWSLQNVEGRGNRLVVILNEDRVLTFESPNSVLIENSELIIDGFSKLTFQWRESGGADMREKDYDSGQVRFIPPLGTKIKSGLDA